MLRADILVVTLFVTLFATAAHAAHPLEGTYLLDRASSDDPNAAIEGVVKEMHAVARPIARRRLKKTNPAYARIALHFTGNAVRINAGAGGTVVLPLSGAPVRWKHDGETLTVSGQSSGNSLAETFQAADGRRTNTFTPTKDGLTLSVTLTSPRLPKPLRYTLAYRRI